MVIKNQILYFDKKINLIYKDANSFDDLPIEKCKQVYGLCFYNGKIVIGFEKHKKHWVLIGGSRESEEKLDQTLVREVKEESNMRIIKFWPIGSQYVIQEDAYQIRYCCLVEPYGPFISDPDGDIIKIKFIDQKYFSKYFNWGKIGERLVKRSLNLINKENNSVSS